jgi:hypothetical protein
VVFVQTSATNVPNELRVLDVLLQTADAIVVLATVTAPTAKLLSIFTKSPPIRVPQLITVGHTPSGAAAEIE